MHKALKSIYLITNSLVLPLAVFYLYLRKELLIYGELFSLGLFLLVPFWLVLFVGLGTFRFPTNKKKALHLLLGSYIQFAISLMLTGTNWLYAVFSMFFVSFVGVLIGLLLKFIQYLWRFKKELSLKKIFWSLMLFFFVAIFVYGLSGPFIAQWKAFGSTATLSLAVLIMLYQIFGVVQEVFALFGREHIYEIESEKRVREKEENAWAPAIAAAIILSLVLTLFLNIFSSPENQQIFQTVLEGKV